MFQLNQRVFDIINGAGTVIGTDYSDIFPIIVSFSGDTGVLQSAYTKEGKAGTLKAIPQRLFPYEVEVVRKRVSFKDLPVDTKIRSSVWGPRHYAGNFKYYTGGNTSHTAVCSPQDFVERDIVLLGEDIELNGITYAEGTQIWPE